MFTIDLRGKIALVVGGSRGIGAAVTETLAQAGAFVTFTHRGNPCVRDKIEALLARIQDKGGQAEEVRHRHSHFRPGNPQDPRPPQSAHRR